MTILRMPLPASPIPGSPGDRQAGVEERELSGGGALLDLPSRYRELRWCVNCAGQQLFVPCFDCEAGRVGVCMGCGEEKLVRWTRTNSEVA